MDFCPCHISCYKCKILYQIIKDARDVPMFIGIMKYQAMYEISKLNHIIFRFIKSNRDIMVFQ